MMDDLTLEHPDLEELFDAGGPLPPRVREHVAGCRQCTVELATLAELRRAARALPESIAPGRDLWTGIAERIERSAEGGGETATVHPLRRAGRAGWWTPGVVRLAAAAVVLVVLTAALTARFVGSDEAPLAAAGGPTDPAAPGPVGLAAFAAAEPEYESTVAALEAELEARRASLSPVTIQIVEQNLAIIDQAIEEARRALAQDPTSRELPLLLSGVYRQKVELLQQAVELTARS